MVVDLIRKYLEEHGIGAEEVSRGTGIEEGHLRRGLEAEEELDFAECVLICRFVKQPIEMFIEADAAAAE